MFNPLALSKKNLMIASPATSGDKPKGLDLYARFAFAGAVCCAVTHGALTPVGKSKNHVSYRFADF